MTVESQIIVKTDVQSSISLSERDIVNLSSDEIVRKKFNSITM
jgi:hypothetical protein